MENKDKYYTPTESEFYNEFEFELQTMTGWAQGSFPDLLDKNNELDQYECYIMKLAHSITRVKYLDKQDFEELGWEDLGSGWYNLKEVSGELSHFCYVRFRVWGTNSFIKAYRYDPTNRPHELENDEDFLFQGNIKNKSQLKIIMQQTNIL